MAGGVITTGAHPKAYWPGVHTFWGMKYNEHPLECLELFDQLSSVQSYEEMVEGTSTNLAPVKTEGGSVSYDTMAQGTISRFEHVVYAIGAIITREAIEDNLYPKLSKQYAGALAFSMRQTKENVAANIYNRGFNSNFVGGDGVAMLSDSHPSLSGLQSNILDIAADISEVAIESLCIQIGKAENSRGLKLSIHPRTIHVPVDSVFETNRILGSVLQSGNSNNDVNVLNMNSIISGGIKVNHYFTDPDAWFIKTDCPDGLVNFSRRAIDFSKDNDFDTQNARMITTERYSFGHNDWRGIFGSPGA